MIELTEPLRGQTLKTAQGLAVIVCEVGSYSKDEKRLPIVNLLIGDRMVRHVRLEKRERGWHAPSIGEDAGKRTA